jgi:hypothetical protein
MFVDLLNKNNQNILKVSMASSYARRKTFPHDWAPTHDVESPLTSQECALIDHEVELSEKDLLTVSNRELLIQYHILVKKLYARKNSKCNICASCHYFCGNTPACTTCGAKTCFLCRKSFDNAPNIKRCPVCCEYCIHCNQVFKRNAHNHNKS